MCPPFDLQGRSPISAKLFLRLGTVEGLLKKNEHRTSNVQHRMLNGKRLRNRSPELLNDILKDTEELIKIFVTSIKTAEKKPRLGVVECSVLDNRFSFDVGRSMFDVRRSSFKTIPYGINVICERLQNNLALMGIGPGRRFTIDSYPCHVR